MFANTHIRFDAEKMELLLLDQRALPLAETTFVCRKTADVIFALQTMVVRGAPAIGVTAGWGCVLALHEAGDTTGWETRLHPLLEALAAARPTAVNLRWGVERMRCVWKGLGSCTAAKLAARWLAEADAIQREDVAINQSMGRYGAACLKDGDTVLTHCNAGALATAGYGTALGVIRAAWEQGKNIRVIADETRPLLQGARLTAWELHADGIPVTLACDNACALLMKRGLIQKVIVGADRIAANGDTANKIGTYGVALLARAHGIPFYVAAPLSTIDRTLATGEDIPLEERSPEEVVSLGGVQTAPEGVPAYNFAFDVTPAELINGIITEKGVVRAPYTESIRRIFQTR